jgi:hypothetical protein
MPAVRYRMYLGEAAATREQLDRVEEIHVDQEVDMAWEARLRVPVCTSAKGTWDGEDEPFLQPFARVRIEVKVGERSWTPLIDGPVVGSDRHMSSEPGQSWLLVIVHDDSAYLNRNEEIRSFEAMSDHEIARQLFTDSEQIGPLRIDESLPCSGAAAPHAVQRETKMQLLQRLARRQGMHAYVLPGEASGGGPGKSIGCFRKFPTTPGDLPELVLVGPDRNIVNFSISANATSPANVQGFSLSIGERAVAEGNSRTRELDLLGPEGALARPADAGTRLLQPDADRCLSPEQAAQVEAERAAFAFEATGSVLAECYGAALAPYQIVAARGVGGRVSGPYLIKKVSHRMDRWQYSQQFTLLRNARSGGTGAGAPDLISSIF